MRIENRRRLLSEQVMREHEQGTAATAAATSSRILSET
jgi:hypothetical protein